MQFDAISRMSLSDQPVPTGGVAAALRNAAESYGLDATAELYNEALQLAAEGEVDAARDRLVILLALSPNDGDAHLLLAKVLVAKQSWEAALASIERARSLGVDVPDELHMAVLEHRTGVESTPARTALEEGELLALRQEGRRLRSEVAHLSQQAYSQEREAKKWAYITGGVSVLSVVFILLNLVFGGSTQVVEVPVPVPTATKPAVAAGPAVTPPAPVVAPPVAPSVAEPPPVAPPARGNNASLVERAAAALEDAPMLEGTRIAVTVDGGAATLSGTVAIHLQRKEAEQLVGAVGGIASVTSSDVQVLARSEGTKHTVVSGDNLSKIAYRYYGDASLSKRILKANKKLLGGKANLQIGQNLVIPKVD